MKWRGARDEVPWAERLVRITVASSSPIAPKAAGSGQEGDDSSEWVLGQLSVVRCVGRRVAGASTSWK